MSRRAAAMLREDMEYMGPLRLSDAEESQERIISIIKHLESTGEIVISKNHEEEIIDGEVSFNKVNHLASLADILEASDAFVKKLVSMFGVRFLASVFQDEENKEEIFKMISKNVPFLKRRKFVNYWNSYERIYNIDQAKECIITLIENERLIESVNNGSMVAEVLRD